MNTEEKLIKIILSLNFKDSKVDARLRTFLNILLTSWDSLNIEAIMSNISIDNFQDTAIFFNELFNYLCDLASKSETSINANNVIGLINMLDSMLPEILISKPLPNVLKEYKEIKEKALETCFERLRINADQYSHFSNENLLEEIKNLLLILTRISRIKYSEFYVYHFAGFLWEMFCRFFHHQTILGVLLFSLSSISDQLAKFLIWKIDAENNLSFRELSLKIFRTLKSNLIECKFQSAVIPYVLNILDCHDRFIGQFADAVPENEFHEGYIICLSMSQPLEPDDVYEAYEQFSALESQ